LFGADTPLFPSAQGFRLNGGFAALPFLSEFDNKLSLSIYSLKLMPEITAFVGYLSGHYTTLAGGFLPLSTHSCE
jgi:hypothetical protein